MRKMHRNAPTLYLAFDLGGGRWQMAFSDGSERRARQRVVAAKDRDAVLAEIALAKRRFGLDPECAVVSVYEAGRDGFWLHRWLCEVGVTNYVVDPASIESNRRGKRAKTDRLDAEKLLRSLIRHHDGEAKVWSVVRVPSEADEDLRRLHRERKRIQEELTSVKNRAHSLLATIGCSISDMLKLRSKLEGLRNWDSSQLPPHLKRELARICQRMELLVEQLADVEAERRAYLERKSENSEMVKMLGSLKGVGMETAWFLVVELFAWRKIRNRKELGALAGLTGVPRNSDGIVRDAGISKAGLSRLRALMVEVSWQWLRYQPDSELSQWFQTRFASAGGRARKRGIVAVARKLLISLWRLVEHGLVPPGAAFKPAGAPLR